MALLSQIYSFLYARTNEKHSLSSSRLVNYDEDSKLDVLAAVDILIEYKSTVQEFTDEIIEFWVLPRRVMERYHFEDAEQLNEWLDGFL